MAADLHIHAITDEDNWGEAEMRAFFSNALGSKYYNPNLEDRSDKGLSIYEKIAKYTENIWVGEVSWLKAALFNDGKSFVPGPIEKISELIGEDLIKIDTDLILAIAEALKIENETNYSLNDHKTIEQFLIKHKGKQVFTVSW